MSSGQYILNRWMVSLIQEISIRNNISFTSYSDDWLIELSKSDQVHRIFGYKFDINDSVASAIAGDKVASYQLLQNADVAAVGHRLVRTKAGDYSDWSKDLTQIVIKPLDGTSGHGVALLQNTSQVGAYIASRPTIASWAVSAFQNIDQERRLIVLDGAVICTYEKQPITINGLKMFNLGLGATAVLSPSSDDIDQLAISAVNALGLRLAAVDIVQVEGDYKVLEVNDGIMMENFMRQSDEYKQIGTEVYRQIILALFNN